MKKLRIKSGNYLFQRLDLAPKSITYFVYQPKLRPAKHVQTCFAENTSPIKSLCDLVRSSGVTAIPCLSCEKCFLCIQLGLRRYFASASRQIAPTSDYPLQTGRSLCAPPRMECLDRGHIPPRASTVCGPGHCLEPHCPGWHAWWLFPEASLAGKPTHPY